MAFTADFAFGSSKFETPEKECNDGDMESCLKAAFQYEDDDKKLKLVKKACDSGKDSPFINPSPKFKETRQTSYGAYEILK
ncbi:hypothetical protein [uncultured Campylobacter sp.]|uniref:hypothetical protein n=1 Tax=uncultured Campylobacter sp. TaxID=218934 RepID=UPI00262FE9D2|nr:hypothetical protein [uncultured Campylobacter sp.]